MADSPECQAPISVDGKLRAQAQEDCSLDDRTFHSPKGTTRGRDTPVLPNQPQAPALPSVPAHKALLVRAIRVDASRALGSPQSSRTRNVESHPADIDAGVVGRSHRDGCASETDRYASARDQRAPCLPGSAPLEAVSERGRVPAGFFLVPVDIAGGRIRRSLDEWASGPRGGGSEDLMNAATSLPLDDGVAVDVVHEMPRANALEEGRGRSVRTD